MTLTNWLANYCTFRFIHRYVNSLQLFWLNEHVRILWWSKSGCGQHHLLHRSCLHVCGFTLWCEVSKDIFILNIVRKSLTQISFDGGLCHPRACVSGPFQCSTGNWLLRGLRPIQPDRWNSPLVTFETQFDCLSSSSLLFRICYHIVHWKRGFT